jgi:hypothetical protein
MAPDEIVEAYPHLSLAQVHAALAYYWQHRDEIEQEILAEKTMTTAIDEQRSGPVTAT